MSAHSKDLGGGVAWEEMRLFLLLFILVWKKKKTCGGSFNFHAALYKPKCVFIDLKGQFQECDGKMFPNKLFPSSFIQLPCGNNVVS